MVQYGSNVPFYSFLTAIYFFLIPLYIFVITFSVFFKLLVHMYVCSEKGLNKKKKWLKHFPNKLSLATVQTLEHKTNTSLNMKNRTFRI